MTVIDHLRAAQRTSQTRRAFLQSLSGLGIGLTALPLIPQRTAAQGREEATLFTWGGFDVEELYAPYVSQHGRFPNHQLFGDTTSALTRLRAGLQVDVAHPCDRDLLVWRESELFQPIDPSRLSHWGDMIPALASQPGNVAGNGAVWFVPLDWGRTSITYRSDLYQPQGGESWDMLWDPRLQGKIGMPASGETAWWAAALRTGLPFDEIATEAGFASVADALRAQRPLVRLYDDNTANIERALATGEIEAALTWHSSLVLLQYDDIPVRFAEPAEGALTWACGLMLHRDAPNVARAYDVINTLLSPEAGAFLIGAYGLGHSNATAFDAVNPIRLAEIGLGTAPVEGLSNARFVIPQSEDWRARVGSAYDAIKADETGADTAP